MKKYALACALIVLASVPASAAAPTTKELLRYVPTGTEVVIGMDVAALRDHPMVQTWLLEHQAAWSGADSDAREFLREAGLDPLHDVDSMVVAVAPRSGGDHGLAVFGGRFDPVSLNAALSKRGGQPVAIGQLVALRLHDAQHPDHKAPLLYVTQDVVLAGDEETLRTALSGPSQASTLVSSEVAAGRLDTSLAFWMVAAIPQQVRERLGAPARGEHGEAGEAFRGMVAASRTVTRVTMQASLTEELEISGSATADTNENAELLRDTVKGAVAAIRLSAQESSPELVDVLRGVRVTAAGNEVKASAAVPVTLIEKLLSEHKQPCEKQAPMTN